MARPDYSVGALSAVGSEELVECAQLAVSQTDAHPLTALAFDTSFELLWLANSLVSLLPSPLPSPHFPSSIPLPFIHSPLLGAYEN